MWCRIPLLTMFSLNCGANSGKKYTVKRNTPRQNPTSATGNSHIGSFKLFGINSLLLMLYAGSATVIVDVYIEQLTTFFWVKDVAFFQGYGALLVGKVVSVMVDEFPLRIKD